MSGAGHSDDERPDRPPGGEPRAEDGVSSPPDARRWRLPDRVLDLGGRPLVMGIVNVTPDSFTDGGRYATAAEAVAHGLALVRQGADLLDVGGESTRPGSEPVSLEEELGRVVPVVRELVARAGVPVSVDTTKAAVARACLEAGAAVVNDVTGLRGDAAMPDVCREFRAGVVLMHMQGTPATMQLDPRYDDVVGEVARFFEERLRECEARGVTRDRVVLDPGIGFGKTLEHNLELLARLSEFRRLGRPLCLGVSRKGFLGRLLGGRPPQGRGAGSLAVVCHALARGAVQVVRVHDVEETRDAVTVFEALAAWGLRGRPPAGLGGAGR